MLAFFRRLLGNGVLGSRPRRMRVCETLSLGEKRYLAIVQIDEQQLLIGSGGISVLLLGTRPAAVAAKGPRPFVVQSTAEEASHAS
ncbi:MAG TPA: flagellar biosynthetic protein FliO [Terriglobia bacterium]|nr:flagellar biosynthetic protein FliO [Terriglobia bacterium]